MPQKSEQKVVIEGKSNVGSITQIVRVGVPTILVIAVLAIAVAVVSGYNLRTLFHSPDPELNAQTDIQTHIPSQFEIDASNLTIYDQNDAKFWSTSVSGQISKVVIEDLDNDTYLEVIVGVTEKDINVSNPGKDSGKILVYHTDGKLWWELPLIDFAPYAVNVGAKDEIIVVENFIVADIGGNSRKEIVVLTRDIRWYPSKLTIVTSQGQVGAEYWHPGFLYDVMVATSRTENGTEDNKFLVVRGENNDLGHRFCAFVLDPENLVGQAPPYYLERIERGTQIWYAAIQPPASISAIQIREMLQSSDQVVLKTSTGHSFYMDLLDGTINTIAADSEGVHKQPPEIDLYP